jgi:hypothetical protein
MCLYRRNWIDNSCSYWILFNYQRLSIDIIELYAYLYAGIYYLNNFLQYIQIYLLPLYNINPLFFNYLNIIHFYTLTYSPILTGSY